MSGARPLATPTRPVEARRRRLLIPIPVLLFVFFAAAGCVHTEEFRDEHGNVVPGSVASLEYVTLGGASQRVWFRGVDTRSPALVLLHGGPGASEAALFRHYLPGLERRFLVVYWEQRGAGRSYHSEIPPESLRVDRFVGDLDELVDHVRSRFEKERVVLLGHSWGTVIGTLYTRAHPEKVAAYVGTGQIADMPRGETLSFEFALAMARERADRDAEQELLAIGPPPHDVDAMLVSRKWVERFGGSFHGELSTGKLIWAALGTDEANLVDLMKFGQGNRFSLERLWPELSRLSLPEGAFPVPVFLLLGCHDWQIPAVVAADWLERIEAPCKRLIWFEDSGHNPPFEEPERFERVLVDEVLPVATGARACPAENS